MKTDSQLQQDVMAELRWEPAVESAQVGVAVKNGVVTLSGEVSSYAEKWEAERAAQRVAGVHGLAIELKVRLSQFGERSDADIARSAENVLEWMTALRPDSVRVMVENGWITLLGDVDWQYQKLAAADGLRHLAGVIGVSDQISIKPRASSAAVKAEIEAALKRQASADSRGIEVSVDNAKVTLSGKVGNWTERELAIRSAWGSAGVTRVVDEMTLAD
ncbi:BON domain-containing protein [Derxia lacustris]|uniref:BON domain-containing protein n=1 Tax=Derxia lacustris TaxID=764842 RepID=UPI000A177D63|nr:BON domain-containing protein [Derxia lacustris]